jgi:hypothetical protein
MVDLEEWSQDSQWKARVPGGKRWLSTNHLVGKGYWVWLIPLASGSISIGIVADNRVHPFETFNRFDRAMQWLEKYEPQCYLKLSELEGQLQDFKVQRNFALNSSQVFSAQRWAITGEAGRFLDPLYSMGSDFIAVANTFITNLIYYDFSGEEGESAVAAYDQMHASFFQFFLQIYQNQYPLFGNAQVMLAKLVWDNALYWGFFSLLFFNRKLADLLFMGSISDEVTRLRLLQDRMQALFQGWNCLETIEPHDILVDYLQLPLLKEFNAALTTKLSPAEFRQRLSSNIARLEELAVAFFYRAAHGFEGVAPGRPVNPLAISLNRENWEKDGLFTQEPLVAPSPDFLKELELIWLKEAPA